MISKKDAVKSWIVYSLMAGFRMYLSDMGGTSSNGDYHYMWEPEIRNARRFVTKIAAKAHGDVAIEQVRNVDSYQVLKILTYKDGMIEIPKRSVK